MNHHPIFSKFEFAEYEGDPNFAYDFIGTKFRKKYNSSYGLGPFTTPPPPLAYPDIGEDYFEWIEILQSIEEAAGTFTFVELGAGLSKWSIRALKAASQKELNYAQAVSVEAEPCHADWSRQSYLDNGFSADCYQVIEAAISVRAEERYFVVKVPKEQEDLTPEDWYGQCLIQDSWTIDNKASAEKYHGRDLYRNSANWGAIKIQAVCLKTLLQNHDQVDMMDMDIQGEEAKVVKGAIDTLNKKVKKLHIGTHGPEIEKDLIQILSHEGWHAKNLYGCHKVEETTYGPIPFLDGVQTWVNPHFLAPFTKTDG